MKNLRTLYRFECKKIWCRRSVQILSLLLITAVLFLNLSPLIGQTQVRYLNEDGTIVEETVSGFAAARLERSYAMEYSGQSLDENLIAKMQAFTAQYGWDCLNMTWVYHTIYELGLNPESNFVSETTIQEQMYAVQDEGKKAIQLTESELSYWEDTGVELSFPLTLAYTRGYQNQLMNAWYLHLLLLGFIVFILSESFSIDRRLNTQMWFQSARLGHAPAVVARILAGVSFAILSGLAVYGLSALIQFGIYGTDGWNTPLQQVGMVFLYSSLRLTAGQALLLICSLSLLIVTTAAAVTMLLSEVTQNGVIALALPYGLLLVTILFNVDINNVNRALSQLWNYFPIQRISTDLFYDERLIQIAGRSVRGVPFTIFLYAGLLGLVLLVCAWHAKSSMRERK